MHEPFPYRAGCWNFGSHCPRWRSCYSVPSNTVAMADYLRTYRCPKASTINRDACCCYRTGYRVLFMISSSRNATLYLQRQLPEGHVPASSMQIRVQAFLLSLDVFTVRPAKHASALIALSCNPHGSASIRASGQPLRFDEARWACTAMPSSPALFHLPRIHDASAALHMTGDCLSSEFQSIRAQSPNFRHALHVSANRRMAETFTLPPLPYDYSALEPYVDATTMQIHHECAVSSIAQAHACKSDLCQTSLSLQSAEP